MDPMGKGTTSKISESRQKKAIGIVNSKNTKHFVKMLFCSFFQFLETSCGDVAVIKLLGIIFPHPMETVDAEVLERHQES